MDTTTHNGNVGVAEADIQTKLENTAQQVKDTTKEKAAELTEQTRDKANEAVDKKATEVSEQVSEVASALRSTSDQIHTEQIAKLADGLADHVDNLAQYLRNMDGQQVVRQMQTMANKSPWGAAAVGMATGFVLARVLKATADDTLQVSHRQINTGYYGATERIDAQYGGENFGRIL